ncbi:MAG: AgmX/PglI C-terminal domain-containing protein [Myxococcota bacterium]|nr:AgmX/PglI C-terminal domain-containing protein [Deltaproteobacteria bacterium]MDQ3340855.1 AgmX/PglI C-terminal domain-containing protein [Myxococcota bacterium]
MRAWILAFALVAACKGGKDGKDKGTPGQPSAKGSVLAGPKVAVATVLAQDDKKPPFLLLVDEAGAVRLAAAASWEDLDANKLEISKKAGPLGEIDGYVRERVGLGMDPVESIAQWDEYSSGPNLDLPSLEDDKPSSLAQDDPPPPEEEDKPDDGEDESGGTGTAMALEEGKMGKKDSDRAEGQYKMKKNDEDPMLARQQAIEQARNAGVLGNGADTGILVGGADTMSDGFSSSGPPRLNDDGTPARGAHVTGAVTEARLERMRAMVLVSPALKATKLIEIVRDTRAAIAVLHAGKIRPLRLDFEDRGRSRELDAPYWLEARVSAKGIVVEAVPDKPIEITEMKELAAALEQARQTRGADSDAPVDVLVDPDIDSQRLIDLLVALDTAGVRTIGMGPMPQPEELARRGKRIPTATLGQPNAMGDLDKALIRKFVKSSVHKMEACYTKALANDPSLAGTVNVTFFILPTGKVASSTASGVDPELSNCVAGVIKAIEFPKPKGGGGVQVNYPFTFRP